MITARDFQRAATLLRDVKRQSDKQAIARFLIILFSDNPRFDSAVFLYEAGLEIAGLTRALQAEPIRKPKRTIVRLKQGKDGVFRGKTS